MKTNKAVIARDLLKPIYIFGRHPAPDQFITRLDSALAKVEAGEDFYVRVRDEVYHVATWFYSASGIPRQQVVSRLADLFAAPEAIGL